ncbi:MAG: Asp-tRNA(Asn)/Glu-tRNA(Gln) amidotransferase subunit GatA [Candidatus Helarchaeota archaeon]
MTKIHDISASVCLEKMRSQEIAVEEVVHSIFSKIEEIEDKIRGYVPGSLYKDIALKKAKELDKKIKKDGKLGSLCGLPIAIKDCINVTGTRTTCGSHMLENYTSPYDATVIRKLKAAEAIIIGKTNMDEFAMGTSTENSYFGPTRNPWDLERVPGGSSGGSGAVVAAREAMFALGSDTGGSVRCPASYCGIVGLKTTYGLVSRYGLVSYACSLEQIAPLTRTVKDCALLLNVITGYDPLDSTTLNRAVPNYLDALETDLKGVKIGLPNQYFSEGIDKTVKTRILKAVEKLEELGAKFDTFDFEHVDHSLPCYYIIAMSEASSNLARYDGMRYGLRVEDDGEWNEIYSKNRQIGFGPEVRRRIMLGTYALSSGYYDAYYLKALKVRTLLKNDFLRAFKDFDVIIGPTMPDVAFKFGELSDPLSMYLMDIYTVPINLVGLPAISIPCGFKNELPIGMQIIGRFFEEQTILNVAHAYEQNTQFHEMKPPT